MNRRDTDILIIGGGAAGMSAALSASENSDSQIMVVDDNPGLGGQIWRSEMGKIKSPKALKLIEKLKENQIEILNGTQVFAADKSKEILCESPDRTLRLKYKKLILATGARERFLPFPGWTLPNVFGAAGLQALVKGGFSVRNKRIVVAGTGPLLLVVAEYLLSQGAKVLIVVEQAKRRKLYKFGLGLWRHPSKLIQTVALRAKMGRIPYHHDSYVLSAEGTDNLEAITINQKGVEKRIECDFLACGFHLVANLELASTLSCEIENGKALVNEYQESSDSVFCAGELTGIGGVELSLIEGEIAGLTAAGEPKEAENLFPKKRALQKFANRLNDTFSLRRELKTLPKRTTIVCRCEDVEFGKLKEFQSFRDAKLQTRCGMGACQGRICGSATEFLFDWENESVRPPIFPVKLENLVE